MQSATSVCAGGYYVFDMKLDFTTLYVVILLNSVGLAITWAMVALSYRTVIAARYWFAALLMTCAAGPFLFLGEGSRLLTYAGVLLTVAGFVVIWQGVRVFYDKRPQWTGAAVILIGSASSMAAFGSNRSVDNIIFSVSQMIPVLLTIACLLTAKSRSVGVGVATAAALVFMAGQGAEAVANFLHFTEHLSTDSYYSVAAWFLVCAISGATVMNLGFLIIVTDQLRAELYSLATHDDLTGLPNRRALRERIILVEKSAKRKNQSVAVMMIDLDQFKTINDQYGHDAGDAALIHISGVLKSLLREFDFLARIGGDEFCILLPNTDTRLAATIAQRLAKAINRQPMHWNSKTIPVPASIGCIEWQPTSEIRLSESLSFADNEMFASKKREANDASLLPRKMQAETS